jgi:hypothetical protein
MRSRPFSGSCIALPLLLIVCFEATAQTSPLAPGAYNSLDQYDPTINPPEGRRPGDTWQGGNPSHDEPWQRGNPSSHEEPWRQYNRRPWDDRPTFTTVCSQCRQPVTDDTEICPHCGVRFYAAEPVAGPNRTASAAAGSSQSGGSQQSGNASSGSLVKAITLLVGGVMALLFGLIGWVVSQRRKERLLSEYLEATRPAVHSITQLRSAQAGRRTPAPTPAVPHRAMETEPAWQMPAAKDPANSSSTIDSPEEPEVRAPPSQQRWLIERGLQKLERELDQLRRYRKDCDSCRSYAMGGAAHCPQAFRCGALSHPRGNLAYAAGKGALWFGFAAFICIATGLLLVSFPTAGAKPLQQVLPAVLPALGGMCLLAGGISFAWNFWGAFKIRNQVRSAAQAAEEAKLGFFNFKPLPLAVGNEAIPLVVPGDINAVHAVMRGKFEGEEVFVGYYEYERAERHSARNKADYSLALMRGAIGKEHHHLVGQLVIMFLEPLQGVPDLQMTPRKDIDFYLEIHCRPLAFQGPWASAVSQQYCVASESDNAAAFFNDARQQFLAKNPGWNLQVVAGHVIVWHGGLDQLSAEIVPGDCERLVADLRESLRWRQMLAKCD